MNLVILIIIIILTIITLDRFTLDRLPLETFNDKQPRYIFWTGGFDSTYCVLDAVFKDYPVIPIYLTDNIDNLDSQHTRRHNHQYELQSITKIKDTLKKKYPDKSKLLKPIQIVNRQSLSNEVKKSMKILFKKGRVRRPVCQYAYLAEYSLRINRPVELAVEYEPKNSIMYRAVNKYLIRDTLKTRINPINFRENPEFNIYRNFRFPTIHLSKVDMLNDSKKRGFYPFLNLTWSCWYPKDGKPCQKCIMCLERII